MAIIVEDGTNVANANSYQAAADITALLVGTPYSTAWAADSGNQEIYARAATQFLDTRFRSYGEALFADQALQWPRTKNYDDKGVIIPAGTIPNQLKYAQALVAGYFSANPDALEDVFDGTQLVKSWATEGLSITFDSPSNSKGETTDAAGEQALGQRFPQIELILRSIATRKDANWLDTSKQTVVR